MRAHDTDIAVILIYHCEKIEKTVWMDVGTASKNNRRFISITEIQGFAGRCQLFMHSQVPAIPPHL